MIIAKKIGKERNYLENGFFFCGGEGKGGKYLGKKIFGLQRRRKRMKLFGKRKYFLVEEKKDRRRRRQIFGEGRYQCLWMKIKTKKEKEEKIWRRNFVGRQVDRRTSKVL